MDSEQHERAKKSIRFILEKAGYHVRNEVDNFDLSASKSGLFIVLLCSDDKEALNHFNDTEFRMEDEINPCKKLVFTLLEDIRLNKAIVIGPQEFSSLIGKLMLSEVIGKEFSLDNLFSSTTAVAAATDEKSPSSLPIEVSEEKAFRIAGIKGEIRLKMIPFWSYKYSCEGEKKFKEKSVPFQGEGAGSINAINGAMSDFNSDLLKHLKIPGSAEMVRPRLKMEDAKKKIIESAVSDLTKRIKFKQESGQTIAYEDKVLSPDPEFFTIELLLFYTPVWQVRGKRIVEINSYNGNILSEPMDDGVEVF